MRLCCRKASLSLLICAAALAVVGLCGCGGGSDEASGRVQIALTDAPGPYASVVLSIREVRIVPAGNEDLLTPALPRVAELSPSRVIDVLSLQFAQTVLGTATVEAGAYSQVRLVLDTNPVGAEPLNYVTLQSAPDVKIPLTTPSGQQSGLKINGSFNVVEGELTALALDFDPSRAIVHAGSSGKYLLKPTGIRVVEQAAVLPTYGALSGTVLPAEAWPTAVVSILPEGSTVPVASGAVDPADGTFRAFVPPGTYTVHVVADGFVAFDSADAFPVSTGNEVAVGDLTLSTTAPPTAPALTQ